MPKSPKIVRVALSQNPYDIHISSGNLTKFPKFLKKWCPDCRRVAVITDENVNQLYSLPLEAALREANEGMDIFTSILPAGEEMKSPELASKLWELLAECGVDRKTVVVAVGGGVVGDLAGFVAATLLRGLRFVQVPTTLLAQVDSSVGGKVGINIPQGKNLVGAFLQPEGVFIDMKTLETLDDRQFRAGLAEVVKYGVILDAEFFEFLEKNADAVNARKEKILEHIVARCCELKAMVVMEDERETTGRRAILNYGHTFGHAVETLCGYGTVLHGEAVGIGMTAAARLARILAETEKRNVRPVLSKAKKSAKIAALADLESRQTALLRKLGIPTDFPLLAAEEVLDIMRHDKKTEHGKYRFVLPNHLGECVLQTVEDREAILAAFR